MKKRFLSLALAMVLALSLLPMTVFAADPKPVKINNVTISNVMTTDEYGTALELLPGADKSASKYEFLYALGNIGFWDEADKEYHIGTFWSYLVPDNANISVHLTKETSPCFVYVYTLKEGEVMLGSRYWQTTFVTGVRYEPEVGKSEADISLTKEYIEGGLKSEGRDPKFDLVRILTGNEDILVWFGGPSAPAPSFTDVPAGEWYADPVAWAVDKGITNGTSTTTFSPTQNCTQAQILTFLYRAARGEGEPTAADMDKAISWAREKGMIDNSFDGNKPCTRSTAVSYIWQAFNKPTAKASSFKDVDANAAYAKAVDWAVEKGITKGDGSESTFAPDKVCTRGHIVTFLYRAYNN